MTTGLDALMIAAGAFVIAAGAFQVFRAERRAAAIREGLALWAGAGSGPTGPGALRALGAFMIVVGLLEIAVPLLSLVRS